MFADLQSSSHVSVLCVSFSTLSKLFKVSYHFHMMQQSEKRQKGCGSFPSWNEMKRCNLPNSQNFSENAPGGTFLRI